MWDRRRISGGRRDADDPRRRGEPGADHDRCTTGQRIAEHGGTEVSAPERLGNESIDALGAFRRTWFKFSQRASTSDN